MPIPEGLLPLNDYDHVIVSYSGGKDSLALVLHALELGVPKGKLELWHNHVDGEPGADGLMDWPCTEGYCRATAAALGVPIRFSWKDGGFEREMLRDDAPTAGMYFEDGDGRRVYCPPTAKSKRSTRMKFPQVSADLSVRWCSAYLKIDVAARALNNDPRFNGSRVLFLTGERREESSARAKYKEVERHRCSSGRKRVDAWRAVIDWKESDVWAAIERHRLRPHPAYYLGWGRVSCMNCIFMDAHQAASSRAIAPARLEKIADYERRFGYTIKRSLTVLDLADKGTPYPEVADPDLIALALSKHYPPHLATVPDGQEWKLPPGAYRRCGGPT